jgi:tetratricopeptide (TPR) repeat protein
VLRRSLGDLKREIEPGRETHVSLDAIPLTDAERQLAESLHAPMAIEAFLKSAATDSVSAARICIAMLALGIFAVVDYSRRQQAFAGDDMQRDLELLAAIGGSDQRSLKAVALSRQLNQIDHYQLLDVPRAATRAQIISGHELMKRRYDAATFPPIVRDSVQSVNRRLDEAVAILRDPVRRAEYDRLLQQKSARGADELQKRVAQRSIAEQNFTKARELSVAGDYYGAIVLLKQAVEFAPDHADAWYLLGACQERNPKWRRDAAESYQRALAIDPNLVDALISLGDLYRNEGLTSRAQSCYEDVLKISAENHEAKRRLQALKKR